MGYVIVATWKAKLGSEAKISGILRELSAASRREPGRRFYQAQESLETPGLFVIYEIYDDLAAAEVHTASDHFRAFVVERAMPLLESRGRKVYETLPA